MGALLLAAVLSLALSACERGEAAPTKFREERSAAISEGGVSVWEESSEGNGAAEGSVPTPSAGEESRTEEREKEVLSLQITAGGKNFSVRLYDSETTRALLQNMPMTLQMNELNGNEKYFDLPLSLPTDAQRPGSIRAGDLMLYGDNCLVLFYESFSSPYAYTHLGYLEDPAGLEEALGSGSIEVSFQVSGE